MSEEDVADAKLVIELPPDDSTSAETVWAKRVGGYYRLMNVPIWAYDLAYEDLLIAEPGEDGRLYVRGVAAPSGLLTVRIASAETNAVAFAQVIAAVRQRAVVTEHYSASYSAFAFEPSALAVLKPMLDAAQRDGTVFWEIANGDDASVRETSIE